MSQVARDSLNWLGFPAGFPLIEAMTEAVRLEPTACVEPSRLPTLGPLMSHTGDATAREPTDAWVWHDERSLRLTVRCHTAAMDRVRTLVSRDVAGTRDAWGDDAVEVQIDPGLTRREYGHYFLHPTGRAMTYRGFNNRQEQGWHPAFEFRVNVEEAVWIVDAVFPFAALGRTPRHGEAWGFNLVRVNPSEPGGYVQWAPTLGDALRPELFGRLTFGGSSDTGGLAALRHTAAQRRAKDVAAYVRRAAARESYFRHAINDLSESDVLAALRLSSTTPRDWRAWSEHFMQRPGPSPVQWDGLAFGADGIVAVDRPLALRAADDLCRRIAGWPSPGSEPATSDPAIFDLEQLEPLASGYALTAERRYAQAFERAMAIHESHLRADLASPPRRGGGLDPYHDYQIVRAAFLAYVYHGLRAAGLSGPTHAAVMWTMLRAGRFAALNIADAYAFGNHQVYESAGLALVALLFPEFHESDDWARVASRSIRLHLERELYPDGGYLERCGYHSVAMTFVMQAAVAIRANGAAQRFEELMARETLSRLEKMHEWVLRLLAPDGTLPAFGDYKAYSQLRFLWQGAAFFDRPDFAAPLERLAPELAANLPEFRGVGGAGSAPPHGRWGRAPSAEAVGEVPVPGRSPSLGEEASSGFTVMRGQQPGGLYMAVDHGPLGGQHSHVDSMGFVAYAFGQPIALDTGLGCDGYADPMYMTWCRTIRAHNVVTVDDAEPEKVARRLLWRSGRHADFLKMRCEGYASSHGVMHERLIVFVKGDPGLWLIHDTLTARRPGHRFAWLLHTPLDLRAVGPGSLDGRSDDGAIGMRVLAGRPEELEEPLIERFPASVPVPEAAPLRIIDAVKVFHDRLVRPIPSVTWRKWRSKSTQTTFATVLLPYREATCEAQVSEIRSDDGDEAGWSLTLGEDRQVIFRVTENPRRQVLADGVTLPGLAVALLRQRRTVWAESAGD